MSDQSSPNKYHTPIVAGLVVSIILIIIYAAWPSATPTPPAKPSVTGGMGGNYTPPASTLPANKYAYAKYDTTIFNQDYTIYYKALAGNYIGEVVGSSDPAYYTVSTTDGNKQVAKVSVTLKSTF